MRPRGIIGSSVLLLSVLGAGGGLAVWKDGSLEELDRAAASQPEPTEVVESARAVRASHARTTTSIGTVLALRSVTLRNELAGTVRDVALHPGAIVEAGDVLVALDVEVEEAELRAQEAEARLAETLFGRIQRALEQRGASEADVDRARAERDVALATVARTRALIERKILRAPFRARVGLSDVHTGQYLHEGTELTTLQGVDDAVHVDFHVAQDVAAALDIGAQVTLRVAPGAPPVLADIVAIDARVDSRTRNALVRALVDGEAGAPAPGSSVRVDVPTGPVRDVLMIPVNALRKGPAGDHVFVLQPDDEDVLRARQRLVTVGAVLGDEIVVESGLEAGDEVATSGSFKLFDGVRVHVAAARAPASAD